MIMEALINATEVRANFGGFIDSVVREKPLAIKRNRDVIFSFSKQQLIDLLSIYKFTVEYEVDENYKYTGSIEQLEGIIGEGSSLEELYLELARQLIEYAKDYYADFTRYYNSPNRRQHAYYIMRVLLEDNEEKVAALLNA